MAILSQEEASHLKSCFHTWIGTSIYELLNKILEAMAKDQNAPFLSMLTEDMHVLPDFHGNRCSAHIQYTIIILCALL